jgi:hypothetical protein
MQMSLFLPESLLLGVNTDSDERLYAEMCAGNTG